MAFAFFRLLCNEKKCVGKFYFTGESLKRCPIIPSVCHHTALYPTASCTKLGNAPYRIGFPINRAEITQYDYN